MRNRFVLAIGLAVVATIALGQTPNENLEPPSRPPEPQPTTRVFVTNDPLRVNGSVAVDNLPLAQDGSVRVSGGATEPLTLELGPYTVPPLSELLTESFDTAGFSSIIFTVYGPNDCVSPPQGHISVNPRWRLLAGQPFRNSADLRGFTQTCTVSGVVSELEITACGTRGPEAIFRLFNSCQTADAVVTVAVFLTN